MAKESAGTGEFGSGAFGIVFECVGEGEPGGNYRYAGLPLRPISKQGIADTIVAAIGKACLKTDYICLFLV